MTEGDLPARGGSVRGAAVTGAGRGQSLSGTPEDSSREGRCHEGAVKGSISVALNWERMWGVSSADPGVLRRAHQEG